MTATATRTFDSMTDFLTNAVPGDTYAEPQRPSARSISTHRFIQRLTADETDHGQRGEGGEVETLTTEHLGKAEIAGRPEYTYRSYVTTNQNYADGAFVSVVIGYGLNTAGRNGVHSTEPAKRMSAKTLRTRHHSAVTELFGPEADTSNTN